MPLQQGSVDKFSMDVSAARRAGVEFLCVVTLSLHTFSI